MEEKREYRREGLEEESGQFSELIKYTLFGYLGGVLLGVLLDVRGQHRSAAGQWLVRTLSGEGESLFEGFYALRSRWTRRAGSLAEAYGWGKFLGMGAPWIIDWSSRWAGVDMYGPESFYIPYFYALSDQIGASVSGLIFLRGQRKTLGRAIRAYLKHPVMLSSLTVVLLVPVGLLMARLAGFSPTTQVLTALETIAANLCWVPPLVGWLAERREKPGKSNG